MGKKNDNYKRYWIRQGDVVLVTDEENEGGSGYMKRRTRTVAVYMNLRRYPQYTFSCENSDVHLLRGQWYGNNPLNPQSHGKNEGKANGQYNKYAYKIGHVSKFRNTKFN